MSDFAGEFLRIELETTKRDLHQVRSTFINTLIQLQEYLLDGDINEAMQLLDELLGEN